MTTENRADSNSESKIPTVENADQNNEAQTEVASSKRDGAENDEDEEIEYYGLGFYDIENINMYNKGGLHPVHLGEVLNGRYEIVHKLGNGGFGIVWLCQDNVTNKWRAVKIMTAEHSIKGREEKIYSHLLRQCSLKELEKNHLVMPSDQFWIEGPNGRHYCIVLPVLGPPAKSWRMDIHKGDSSDFCQTITDARTVCAQIAQAVGYLHQSGVCHGDLKPDNVMMEVRGLDDLDKAQLLELLGEPETHEVETESGDPPAPRAPEYVVRPSENFWWKDITSSSAAIIDFGASFLTSDPPESNDMSLGYAAPEVIWHKTFQPGPHSDIWSLAVILFQMLDGGDMFDDEYLSSTLQGFEYFLGGLPEPYRSVYFADRGAATGRPPLVANQEEHGQPESVDEASWEPFPIKWKNGDLIKRREKYVKETGYSDHFEAALGLERQYRPNILSKDDITDEERHMAIKYKISREDVLGVADLLRKMLRYDPAKRIPIDEVISRPWFGRCSRSSGAIKAIRSRVSL
ncbi:kinase-like protein [Xylariaceae sp. AK1471]|nr:kinase-like protein [Xylariaceae sp. AK1471]